MGPIHVTLGIILQAGNATGNITGLPSPSQLGNEIATGILSPIIGYVELGMGIAFIVAVVSIMYHFAEYMFHFTSWGRTAALNEVFSHGKKIIFGSLGLWLTMYAILLIFQLVGVKGVNPASTAWQIFQGEFVQIWNLLHTALQHATSPTP